MHGLCVVWGIGEVELRTETCIPRGSILKIYWFPCTLYAIKILDHREIQGSFGKVTLELLADDEQSVDKRLFIEHRVQGGWYFLQMSCEAEFAYLQDTGRGSWYSIVWINFGVAADVIARRMSQRYVDIERPHQIGLLLIENHWQEASPPSPGFFVLPFWRVTLWKELG